MKLIICDLTYKKEFEIENAEFIPRKGDRVATGYTPAPTVDEVVFCYEENLVVISVK